jgi:adenine C2-methylase RlmN of 23S rRNA A2503 and tRNA A37
MTATFLGLPLTADQTLFSTQDASVNFITPVGPNEAFEARYVRRQDEYLVVYVSVQSACSQGCRFCHLTASGQVNGRDASLRETVEQAGTVLDYYADGVANGTLKPARVVHFNFMARGEPMASEVIRRQGAEVIACLNALARDYGLVPVMKLSSIFPGPLPSSLFELFPDSQPDWYYSLYTLDPVFRKKWLPSAADPSDALDLLVDWQHWARKIPVLHYALIAGENDSMEQAAAIVDLVRDKGLRADFNLVAYNPPSSATGVETDPVQAQKVADMLSGVPGSRVRVVKRVGFDVAASCGMFVGGSTPAVDRVR